MGQRRLATHWASQWEIPMWGQPPSGVQIHNVRTLGEGNVCTKGIFVLCDLQVCNSKLANINQQHFWKQCFAEMGVCAYSPPPRIRICTPGLKHHQKELGYKCDHGLQAKSCSSPMHAPGFLGSCLYIGEAFTDYYWPEFKCVSRTPSMFLISTAKRDWVMLI